MRRKDPILTLDDLRDLKLKRRFISPSLRTRLSVWATQEIERREKAGKTGGRPVRSKAMASPIAERQIVEVETA